MEKFNFLEDEEKILDEVNFNIYKKDFKKALSIMEGLVDKIEKSDTFSDDKTSIYLDFDELLELVLYQVYEKPTKTIKRPPVKYHYIYELYGSLLFEVRDLPKAKIYLEKSLRWNPISVRTAFEMGEIMKVNKDLESYYQLNKNIYKNIFKRADMARYLRNMSYYFIEKELFDVASACLYASLSFEVSDMARGELFFIQQKTGKNIPAPKEKVLEEYSEKYGIMFQPCREVMVNALAFSKFALENNDIQSVKYMLKVIYDFIFPDSMKAKMASEMENTDSVKHMLKKIYEVTNLKLVKEMLDEIENKGKH